MYTIRNLQLGTFIVTHAPHKEHSSGETFSNDASFEQYVSTVAFLCFFCLVKNKEKIKESRMVHW